MTLREAWRTPPTPAPTDADRRAIEACVLDYFEGWFDADPERYARSPVGHHARAHADGHR